MIKSIKKHFSITPKIQRKYDFSLKPELRRTQAFNEITRRKREAQSLFVLRKETAGKNGTILEMKATSEFSLEKNTLVKRSGTRRTGLRKIEKENIETNQKVKCDQKKIQKSENRNLIYVLSGAREEQNRTHGPVNIQNSSRSKFA